MKNFFAILTICFLSLSLSAKDNGIHVDISVKSLNSFSNVSGAYVGIHNNYIIAGGGSNFSTPMVDGGTRELYRNIYVRKVDTTCTVSWRKMGEFPTDRAFGTTVSTPFGVVCLGGVDYDGNFPQTLIISYDEKNKSINIDSLNPIPIPLNRFAATYNNGEIVIAGGISNNIPSRRAFMLNIKERGSKWREIAPIREIRVSGVMATQNSSEQQISYLFGGYTPSTSSRPANILSNGEYYNPKLNKWFPTADINLNNTPTALISATATSFGGNFILFFGGANIARFAQIAKLKYEYDLAPNNSLEKESIRKEFIDYLSKKEEYYQFNTRIIGYNTITDCFTYEGQDNQFGKIGASLARHSNNIYILGGEIKPGVTSDDMVVITPKTFRSFGLINWLVVIIYLLSLLYIGYRFMKEDKGSSDFFTGGGKIPWWAAGMSIFATMLSAITFMAIPAKVYATDWQYFPMAITILIITIPIIRYYLPFFRSLKTASAYQYLEIRFNYPTRLLASVLFIVFMIARMALVLYLPSLALSTAVGIDIYVCITILGVITMIYSSMGGIKAVIWGDVVQGFLLLGGAITALAFLIFNTHDGLRGFIDTAVGFDKFKMITWDLDFTKTTIWVVVIGSLAANLISYSSDQTVIQRYMTTDSIKNAKKSIILNGVMSVVISAVFYLIGTALFTFFKTNPQSAIYTLTNSDAIFPFYIMSQLPTGVAGLIIAAIFAATMSTVSSNINSVSTAFTVDIFNRYAKINSDKKTLLTARVTSVVSGTLGILLAIIMASWNIISLFDYFNTILGLFASGLGGLFLLGIFFKNVGAKGALIGFVFSTIIVIIISITTEISFLMYGAIGLILSVVIGNFISWILNETDINSGLTWVEFKNKKNKE